jgi:hypothetical protein
MNLEGHDYKLWAISGSRLMESYPMVSIQYAAGKSNERRAEHQEQKARLVHRLKH